MADGKKMLVNSIIIGAHPDDELLWFSSILHLVDEVVVVFEDFWPDPTLGPARVVALNNFPRKIRSLKLAEAATFGCADWENPVLTSTGIKLGRVTMLRDGKKKLKKLLGRGGGPKAGIQECYNANYDILIEKLRAILKPDMNVFTHNPWGEYGHEDHIQVFRAIDQLRGEIGFKLWMSNYCTKKAMPLAMSYSHYQPTEIIQMPVNKEFAERTAQVYRDAGCWTWADDWSWFDTELFMEAPLKQGEKTGQEHHFPLNFFAT